MLQTIVSAKPSQQIRALNTYLKNGFEVNTCLPDTGKNGLHFAVESNNYDLVKAFIEAHIDINIKTLAGKSALDIAIETKASGKVRAYLSNILNGQTPRDADRRTGGTLRNLFSRASTFTGWLGCFFSLSALKSFSFLFQL